MGLVKMLSSALSTREDGLLLLISILAGYPLATIHRVFLYNKPAVTQHLYFVAAGILLYIYSYGIAVLHSVFSIFSTYLIIKYFGGKKESVVLAHIVILGYLLIAYSFYETDQYDINWTTPFCIMTLRFIGLIMDVYDGHKDMGKLKTDQIQTAIKDPPGILEIAAYGYFFCGTFVGPLFPLARFRAFVEGKYLENNEVRQSSLLPSLGRFVGACFFAVIHQWGCLWIPSDYLNSAEFFGLSFKWRVIWIVLWFRFTMYRYVCCWLFTEGAAILAGLAYNGKDENGDDRWDGVRDVHILKFEFGIDFQSVIESFNVGTNTFAKNHLFRRLRWMNNRMLSHLATLMYLAVWHGYHLGYFVLFLLEMASVVAQQQFYSLISRLPNVSNVLSKPYMYPIKMLFGRFVISTTMGIGFLTFGLVKTRMWLKPLVSVYFFVHIFYFIVWPLIYRTLDNIIPKGKSKSASEKTE